MNAYSPRRPEDSQLQETIRAVRLLSTEDRRRLCLYLVKWVEADVEPLAESGTVEVHRPSRRLLAEDIKTVMGGRTMTAVEVHDALAVRGWLPESQHPTAYIAFKLASLRDEFTCPERGHYRARAKSL